MAEAAAGEETIVYGDLDLGRIAEEQQSLDVVGHYNRPDVFDLRVDASSRRPVTWKRSPAQTYAEVEIAVDDRLLAGGRLGHDRSVGGEDRRASRRRRRRGLDEVVGGTHRLG